MGKDSSKDRPSRPSNSRKFGPSQASVRVAPGQTEEQVLAVMRSILGRPRAALREAANLAGAPDDAVVSVAVAARHGRRIIESIAQNSVMRIEVSLQTRSDGRPVLVNEQVDVIPVAQRHGVGTTFVGRQVEQAVRLGIVEIRAYAVRWDQMGNVGYLVWPLLGFDGPFPPGFIDRLPPELAAARQVSDLMKTPEGRVWWIRNGDDINLTFDLSPGSPARRRFRAYLRRKSFPRTGPE